MKSAYEWTLLFLAFGLIVQTLEYLSLYSLFTEKGIWRWSQLRREFSYLRFFDFALEEKPFFILLMIRLGFSVLLLFSFSFPVVFTLFLTSLLIAQRFRGSFNGGSDYMTSIVLSALSVAAFFQTEKIMTGALWFIALQSVISYFLAGLVKIKQPLWRNGQALSAFLHSPNYNPPEIIKKLFTEKKTALACAWAVMTAELFFPLVLFLPRTYVLAAVTAAFLFHLTNVWLFGLNRFLLAWLSTYPAIYFVANKLSNSP